MLQRQLLTQLHTYTFLVIPVREEPPLAFLEPEPSTMSLNGPLSLMPTSLVSIPDSIREARLTLPESVPLPFDPPTNDDKIGRSTSNSSESSKQPRRVQIGFHTSTTVSSTSSLNRATADSDGSSMVVNVKPRVADVITIANDDQIGTDNALPESTAAAFISAVNMPFLEQESNTFDSTAEMMLAPLSPLLSEASTSHDADRVPLDKSISAYLRDGNQDSDADDEEDDGNSVPFDVALTSLEYKYIQALPASKLPSYPRFLSMCQYFRGDHHVEDIMLLSQMSRAEVEAVIDDFRQVLVQTLF